MVYKRTQTHTYTHIHAVVISHNLSPEFSSQNFSFIWSCLCLILFSDCGTPACFGRGQHFNVNSLLTSALYDYQLSKHFITVKHAHRVQHCLEQTPLVKEEEVSLKPTV